MGGYTSITGAVRKMATEEGIRGFYKGLYPNLLKVPSSSRSTHPSLVCAWAMNVVFVWVLTLW